MKATLKFVQLLIATVSILGSNVVAAELTGKYGCISKSDPSGFENTDPEEHNLRNTILHFDFDNNTLEAVGLIILDRDLSTAYTQSGSMSTTFTISNGPITNSKTITTTAVGSQDLGKILLLPVNSGNTLLISGPYQGIGFPVAGTCQKN